MYWSRGHHAISRSSDLLAVKSLLLRPYTSEVQIQFCELFFQQTDDVNWKKPVQLNAWLSVIEQQPNIACGGELSVMADMCHFNFVFRFPKLFSE